MAATLLETTVCAVAVFVETLDVTTDAKFSPGIINEFATIVPVTITLPAETLPEIVALDNWDVPLRPTYL